MEKYGITRQDEGPRALTAVEFQGLAEVPPALEWFANIGNEKTRRAYQIDVQGFMDFAGIERPEEFRLVTRAHVIAWRREIERGGLAPSTLRRKLSALSSLFAYLCEKNAVLLNPVMGVKRPKAHQNEGLTPALSDDQARRLLETPPADTIKGKRDRAILATLLYHGMRRRALRLPASGLLGLHGYPAGSRLPKQSVGERRSALDPLNVQVDARSDCSSSAILAR